MNKVIKIFGETVGKNIENHPNRSLTLLRLGYWANGLKMQYLPSKNLLPSQAYAAVESNNEIRYPLAHPENSAVVNIFFPCELLHTMGISTQFVEGLACYINGAGAERYFLDYAENLGIPKSYCSYHKTLLGGAFSGVIPKPNFVINTTLACDANILTFRSLADYWDVPHFVLDVPNEYNEETIAYVELQLKEAVKFMEKTLGKKFDMDKLRDVLETENRSIEMYNDFVDKLATKYMPNTLTSEMYKLFFTHILLGTDKAEKYFKLLQKDINEAEDIDFNDSKNNKIRVLWVHTIPFWQDSIRDIFDNSDKYQLLSVDLNLDHLDTLDIEKPFNSLAKKLLSNPMRGDVNNRANHILKMAKKLNADGVVYFNHWGCKNTLGGANLTKDLLEEHGIPTITLDGDGCDRNNVNDGQMLTRLQAFLEILEG